MTLEMSRGRGREHASRGHGICSLSSRSTPSFSLAPKGGLIHFSQLPSLGMAQRCWLPGSLSGSPHPPRTQSGLLNVLPKMEYPLSHMTSVCWKSSPSKEGVTLQNSSALGLAGFSRKVWEGSRILSAAEPGVQGDAEKTGKTQSWKLFLIRPRAVEQHSRRVSMLSGQPGANDSTSW